MERVNWNDVSKLIVDKHNKALKDRAKEARKNLLAALVIELKHIPEAKDVIQKYIDAHSL